MYLAFCNLSPHRMFLPLDFLSENIGSNVVPSVSGFSTDCPCSVWCRGFTNCLLYVCPLFGNWLLNNSWAMGLTYWIVNLQFFCILTFAIVYVLIYHPIFRIYLYFLNSVPYFYQVLLHLCFCIDVLVIPSISNSCTYHGEIRHW